MSYKAPSPNTPPAPTQGASKTAVAVVGALATAALAVSVVAIVLSVNAGERQTPAAAPATVTTTVVAGDGQAGGVPADQPAGGDADPVPADPDPGPLLSVPGVAVGAAGAALEAPDAEPTVRLDLFADYMCPFCGQFENQFGSEIQGLVDAGKISYVTHPLSFLDEASNGTEYSTRAAKAAYSVALLDPEHFGAFNAALFAQQPAEGTDGLSDEEIASIATEAGVSGSAVEQLTTATDGEQVKQWTRQAFETGLSGTPTLLLTGPDGQTVKWDQSKPLDQAVEEIAGQ
jgi:protein-disulfide isomerase